jgi:hypothetical protein
MKTICRFYTPEDNSALLELWNENAEWGVIDREQWEKVFYRTPYGPSSIVLLQNKATGEILAQFVFIPLKVMVNGKEIDAFKPCAPIMKISVRKELGLLPFFKMYQFGTKYFASKGTCLFYMMPDPRWVRGLQFVPGVQVASFPLWLFPLSKVLPVQLPPGYALENLAASDPRIDDLWEKASRLHNCSIVRNAQSFSWKISHRNYQFTSVTHENRIVGFSVFIYKKEIKGIAICDVLAQSEEAFKQILQCTAANALAYRNALPETEQAHCEKVTILATPFIEKIVGELGFEKYNYKFNLAVQVKGKVLSKKEVNPERWYVSAND